MNYNRITESISRELIKIAGADHVIVPGSPDLSRYSKDQVDDPRYARMPEAVIKPGTGREISDILKLANREHFPVTPRGAGSGLSGGATPVYGGVVLSLERMNRIIEIDRDNMTAVVEPGVVTSSLDEELEPLGLFFAGYPMSEEFCFIGGNVAENAGGGRAVKYGVTGQYVLGLQVVTPKGEITRIGGKRFKDVTGYDLVKLLTGSEGTLGIFTEITIRLSPRPEKRIALLAEFADAKSAVKVVSRVMTDAKVIPSSAEYMDGFSYGKACESLKIPCDLPSDGAVLLFEVDGNMEAMLEQEITLIEEMCSKGSALSTRRSTNEVDRLQLWQIRKRVPWALKRITPYQSAEDISVPFAAIAELASIFQAMSLEYHVPVPAFGHAADGNIHAHPMKPDEMAVEEWESLLPRFLADLYRRSAELGGTVSGEHGIGHKRKDYMSIVTDTAAMDMMRSIKKVLDPNLILNPGKIFDL